MDRHECRPLRILHVPFLLPVSSSIPRTRGDHNHDANKPQIHLRTSSQERHHATLRDPLDHQTATTIHPKQPRRPRSQQQPRNGPFPRCRRMATNPQRGPYATRSSKRPEPKLAASVQSRELSTRLCPSTRTTTSRILQSGILSTSKQPSSSSHQQQVLDGWTAFDGWVLV